MSEEQYSIEGLEHGIERCDINIAALEGAIEKERNTKKEYRIMIDSLETSERKMKEAEKWSKTNIEIEVDNDDQERHNS